MLKQELTRAFRQKNLYIALSVFLFCLSVSSAQIWLVRSNDGDALLMSAMDLCFIPVFFGGSILLVPFCASIGCSQTQVEEINSRNIQFRILRSNYLHYSVGKLFSAMITGFVVLGGAFAIHTLIWHFVAGPYDVSARPDIEVSFAEGTVYYDFIQQPWAYGAYLHAIVGFGLTGAVWAVISMLCAVLLADTVLSVSIPVVLYYLWKSNFTRYLFGFSMPDFTGLYNDGVLWNEYWQTLAVHLVLLGLSGIAYVVALKRRIRNA